MERFLRGLLHDLERRCALLRDRLGATSADPDVAGAALTAYREIERARRGVAALLADPSLGTPALLPNHLQQYKRWHEQATLIEYYPLPFIERYADADRRLTRLCRHVAGQVGWPAPPPLVGAFSSQYYWTVHEFNVVCAPPTEGSTLLGLPDLFHELGHILLLHHQARLVGDFVKELRDHFERERRRLQQQGLPPEYVEKFQLVAAQWADSWLLEFVSDMVATYLVGPAFGWQHIRLCSGTSQSVYYPAVGKEAVHPADEARLRGIIAVLNLIGAAGAGGQAEALWHRYVSATRDRRPADYDWCYPQPLLISLADRVVAGCRALGLQGFDRRTGGAGDIVALLNRAWVQFLAASQAYPAWEAQETAAMWNRLGIP